MYPPLHVTCMATCCTIPSTSTFAVAIELYGEWSELEMHVMQRFIAPGDTIVEAGVFFLLVFFGGEWSELEMHVMLRVSPGHSRGG